ncbi:MAG: serine/threonine protein kinase [Planctomycetes bacterium]|nr:serine/threonine protein kinase [Planctomycetota bacterium]
MSNNLTTINHVHNIRLTRKIAEGGMGAVYEGLLEGEEGFEKTVAVKTIIPDISSDEEFVDMFIGEAKLVADLIHQNIVQVYHLGKQDKIYYILMEFVHGVNLEQFLEKHHELGKRIPIEIAAYIASRVCRGLEYAHKKADRKGVNLGVVHRDISPKNIMITALGEIKITDFGIAKAFNLMKNREGEVLMGKVQYMSPEQARFEQTDRRSDLFSLGVVMWELLGMRELFEDAETSVILDKVVRAPLADIRQFCPEIPPMLEKILKKSLERDLATRYQDAGKMGYDLEYYMYHKGYGPTIVTMEKYVHGFFPNLAVPGTASTGAPDDEKDGLVGDTVVLGEKDKKAN